MNVASCIILAYRNNGFLGQQGVQMCTKLKMFELAQPGLQSMKPQDEAASFLLPRPPPSPNISLVSLVGWEQ